MILPVKLCMPIVTKLESEIECCTGTGEMKPGRVLQLRGKAALLRANIHYLILPALYDWLK